MSNSKTLNLMKTIVIIILILLWFKSCNEKVYYEDLVSVRSDSVLIYKNKFGLSEAKLKVEVLSKKELRKQLDTLKITRHTKQIAQVKTQTVANVKTKTIVTYDTIAKSVSLDRPTQLKKILFPIYTGDEVNKWYTIRTVAKHDTIHTVAKFKNQLLLEQFQTRGVFREQPIIFTATQQNPHTTNTDVKVYKMKSRGTMFDVEIVVGSGYDVLRKQFVPLVVTVGVGKKLIK